MLQHEIMSTTACFARMVMKVMKARKSQSSLEVTQPRMSEGARHSSS